MLLIVVCLRLFSQSVVVDNITDLKNAIENAGSDLTITFSDAFVAGDANSFSISATIAHSHNITIDGNVNGNPIVFPWVNNVKHISLNKTVAGGEITLKNMYFIGNRPSSNNGGGASFSGTGPYKLDNTRFENINGQALSNSSVIEITNSSFINNYVGSAHGGAICNTGTLTVTNCLFEKNTQVWGGYSGGAIGIFMAKGPTVITKSVFLENGTNGRGGGIAAYLSSSPVTIDECYFEGNYTLKNGDGGSNDGGGVAIFGNNNTPLVLNLKNSTFYRNKSIDDGGAVFIENYAAGAQNIIYNCTMFENESEDVNPATTVQFGITFNVATSGGALQASLPSPVTLENNTIVRNYTLSSYKRGGGVGFHANSSGAPKFTLRNNIILGNYIKEGASEITNGHANFAGKATFNPTYPENSKNIGFDNGATLATDITIKNTFGTDNIPFFENHKEVNNANKVGNPNETDPNYFRMIPTIPIVPNDDPVVKGLANGQGISPSLSTTDQRGYGRTTTPDIGSIEIVWVRFNAGDGTWTGLDDTFEYDGTDYYKSSSEEAQYYYKVTYVNGKVTVPATLTPPANKEFDKWVLDNGNDDTAWVVTTAVTGNVLVKALYKDIASTPFKVTYYPNGGGGAQQTVNCASDNTHTILSCTDVPLNFTAPANHTFAGWNTAANGSGTSYTVSTVLTCAADVHLYAQWKANSVIPTPEPELSAVLQWSVSTNDNQLSSFIDVDNNTTTAVEEGTPVFLQIRPIVDDPSAFDSWEILYTATPTDYHYPMAPISGSVRYDFNEANPHELPGLYKYTVRTLFLYKGNKIVGNFDYTQSPCTHTIMITKKFDPDPDTGIQIKDMAGICPDETEIRIPYMLIYQGRMEYTVSFSEKAKKAGFKDITEYKALPNDYITIPVPVGVTKGKYEGTILLRSADHPNLIPDYNFEFEILGTTWITKQPASFTTGKCEGDGFRLSVEANGDELSYQWFYNKKKIVGATSDYYEAVLSPETSGTYYVEVYGLCGMDRSEDAHVSFSPLTILMKWNDVLYVNNTDNRFVRFQWHKDGQPITQHGTSVYYTDPNGLNGRYFVRAYMSPTAYEESCEIYFNSSESASLLKIYPTIVPQHEYLTVESNEVGETYIGASIELYDMSGRKVYSTRATSSKVEIPMSLSSGSYVVHVQAVSGKKTVHKIIVK